MDEHLEHTKKLGGHAYSTREFANRVVATLTALVVISSVAVVLLIYLPLKAELQQSLVENFSKLAYIRYAGLQNSMERGMEGARSMSSRSVIRDAILDYKNGRLDLDGLIEATQNKYEDGAGALEYLLKAERLVDDTVIARYMAPGYEGSSCDRWDGCATLDEASSVLCLASGHEYFAVRSPIIAQGQVLGYDQLVFDLSGQIHALCSETIRAELNSREAYSELLEGADIVRTDDSYALFYKNDSYHLAYHMQNDTHFVVRQDKASLLEPVSRVGQQVLFAGIVILFVFALAIDFFVIRHAKDQLEDGHSSLRTAVTEANTDALTGAGSRRYGEVLLTGLFERFRSNGISPAVMLFDVDGLKRINDTYGHPVGDLAISAVAEAVQKCIRKEDVLLRWGGDEFIGIFDGLDEEDVIPFAHKLRDAVSDVEIDTGAGVIRPSVSVGLSYFVRDDRSYSDAVDRADRAMYLSKSADRAKVHKL